MHIEDKVEKLCIESGIYKYLYVEEIYGKLKNWAEKRGVRIEEIGGKIVINRVLTRYFGQTARFSAAYPIADLLKGKHLNAEKGRKVSDIKYFVVNIEKQGLWRSLIQNLVYRVFYIRSHMISLSHFLKEVGIDDNTNELLEEFVRVIMFDLDTYKKHIGTDKEAFYNKRLIADYLQIRDFKNARKYVDILDSRNLDDGGEIKRLMNDVEDVLAELKKAADEKNLKHIVWNWMDRVIYRQLKVMPFLEKSIKSGINFTNMYCVTPYTTGTMQTIATGDTFIDDGLWKLTKKDIAKGRLFAYIKKKGYDFVYIGSKYTDELNTSGQKYHIDWTRQFIPSTVHQYELLKQMSMAEKPTLFLVHNFDETHHPYINPEEMAVGCISSTKDFKIKLCQYGKISDGYLAQLIRSSKYFDEQLEYYHKYYTKSIQYEIFFSDHGDVYYKNKFDSDGRFHICLGIQGEGIYSREVTSLQSLKVFPDIVAHLLDREIEKIGTEYDEEYVPIQLDDLYGARPNTIKLLKDMGGNFFILNSFFQFRGILTKEDCFIKFANGYEYYERGAIQTI